VDLRDGEPDLAEGNVLLEPSVGAFEAFAQIDARAPTRLCESRHVEQLARRSIRLRGVGADLAPETNYLGDKFGRFED